jgi:hypothetical protein
MVLVIYIPGLYKDLFTIQGIPEMKLIEEHTE